MCKSVAKAKNEGKSKQSESFGIIVLQKNFQLLEDLKVTGLCIFQLFRVLKVMGGYIFQLLETLKVF